MMSQKGTTVSRRLLFLLLLPSVMLAVVACGSNGDGDGDGGATRLRVVASTALIGEFASMVAGDAAEVTTLIPAGVDLHSYEPSPGTAGAIADADIVFVNGYNLEEGLLDVILENAADDVEVVAVAGGLSPLEGGDHDDEHADDEHADDEHADDEADGGDGHDGEADAAGGDHVRAEGDPHFWLDAQNAAHYVEVIRDRLVALDPAERAGYEARASAYLAELDVIDDEVRSTIARIPEERRRLVVMHDAYQYLAAAYGLELVAALLPVGAQQDPAAGAVVELIELVNELEVPAIYREPQFSGSVLDAVAEETGVRVLTLHSTIDGTVDSYAAMMRANAEALVDGLGS